MKIKILKDEYLFSEQGAHVLDARGIAIRASDDIEVEVLDEHVERVKDILTQGRLIRGLDADGIPIPEPSEPVAPIEE